MIHTTRTSSPYVTILTLNITFSFHLQSHLWRLVLLLYYHSLLYHLVKMIQQSAWFHNDLRLKIKKKTSLSITINILFYIKYPFHLSIPPFCHPSSFLTFQLIVLPKISTKFLINIIFSTILTTTSSSKNLVHIKGATVLPSMSRYLYFL